MSIERRYLTGEGDAFGPTVPTPEQKLLLEELQKLEQTMVHRKKHLGYSREENTSYFEQEMYRIQERYYLRNEAIVSDLTEQVEKARQKYQAERLKTAAQDQLEFHRWETRYGAMDKEQLLEEAGRYIKDPEGWSPDMLDILSLKLAQKGIKKVSYSEDFVAEDGVTAGPVQEKPFTEWIEERHGRQPWREMCPEAIRGLELYQQEFGQMNILDENGEISIFDISKAYMETST